MAVSSYLPRQRRRIFPALHSQSMWPDRRDGATSRARAIVNTANSPDGGHAAKTAAVVLTYAAALYDLAVALVRQDVGSADRGAEAVEPRERVGSAVERVVIAEGTAWFGSGDASVGGFSPFGVIGERMTRTIEQHSRRQVRVVCEVLAEGGDVHADSLSPAMGCHQSRAAGSP